MLQISNSNLFHNYHDPLNPLWRFLFIPGVQTRPKVLHPSNLLFFWGSIFLNGDPASFTDMDLAPSFTCTMEVTHTRLLEFKFTRTWESWRSHTGSGHHIVFALLLLWSPLPPWPLWGPVPSLSWDIYIKQHPLGSGGGVVGGGWGGMGCPSFPLLQVSILPIKASYFPESNFGASWLVKFNIHLWYSRYKRILYMKITFSEYLWVMKITDDSYFLPFAFLYNEHVFWNVHNVHMLKFNKKEITQADFGQSWERQGHQGLRRGRYVYVRAESHRRAQGTGGWGANGAGAGEGNNGTKTWGKIRSPI